MDSPCTKTCILDDRDRCIGCERTIDEIARWSSMTEGQRSAVTGDLDRRRRDRLDAA